MNQKISTRVLISVALMLALTFILQQIKLFHMPQGGSVTPGGMIPLILISLRYGMKIGAMAGFMFGLIEMIIDPFIVHPIQILFDYPLPYMSMALAGLLKDHRFISVVIAFDARFTCHFISGVAFFGSYAPEGMSPFIYSAIFNATYLIPELIISLVILKLLPLDRLFKAMHD